MKLESVNASPDNRWKRGLRQLSRGVYADNEGGLHIDAEELLLDQGYPPTEHNIAMLEEAVRDWYTRCAT